MRRTLVMGAALTALLAGPASAQAVPKKVQQLHQKLLTLDSHMDTPASLDLPGWSIEEEHDVHLDYTQVDLPRMKKGGLDGGFWAIYTSQGPLTVEGFHKARDFAILRGVSIRQMVAADPANFALALEAKDAAPIAAAGKRVVYMSIENAYPLGEDVSLLQTFYDMGVRVVGFAHFAHNQFADSSTDPSKKPRYGGLSPLGKELLKEMNRLGVVPDASHSSDQVLDDLLALSTTPVLLTHSGCKAIYDHPRNIDDDHLKALAAKGGVIQMNAYGSYLKASKPNPERQKAMGALFASLREGGAITAEKRAELLARRQEIDRLYPETDRATFDDFMTHMLHALKVVGPDHVGIGADWDGGGGVVGMEDVVDLPRITDALLKAGYSEADVQKIWSGNVLRVLAAAEAKKGK
ncbi:MAG: membrane dipeptidase [Sphingobium sp.]|uniref:dipeptidase n=1 Tax=Sphingobium sp. TaxID=1912891 RepID=UPI000C3E9F06|nr:dipeptidase [Sphingobium sp.]MBU0658469.1 dipeptidase [Alphaproteobacteria bacterium]MBA4753714.1 dipeptidase [Sphingobium sp.]MBS86900.1 peptidase M19 [Sphingobium sp.]MBU0775290.1 dipeptidase [Alphaproteobacteria bacterium]MBU1796513.1 dipeptidase [Alphaproteobacteria bacterium]